LGQITDYLTGQTLPDTLDERYRQQLARRLVAQCGYRKEEIRSRLQATARAGDKKATVPVDLAVEIHQRLRMIVRFGPGSLVTRHRPALAAARLLADDQIPVVVVTNGEAADILDGATGKKIGHGLDAIPNRTTLLKMIREGKTRPISQKQAEVESRLLYAYEVDDACPCDDTVCRQKESEPL
jgi:hypothetical protein